ncbi:hypothetical protein FNF29_00754 [Cafeteria roenbergensis]|uniref:Helicase ATP-binding domain-containing protein n=1 Tax=Cafeteria roenbergensis TaxID=33653 RepID=A0A5A8CU84_CAFRO|nr:hypothetical protein FNF29_00754 [Cafeteria roenbergensis]|eukprot:KAA0156643.1 hypothetical protein FNF29_00754 [Cafeteria roenbergensis]
MPVLELRGVDVEFPFTPYDAQCVYMEKVLECLQDGTNALLESPTGTGKTISLLCSALAWQGAYAAGLQVAKALDMLVAKHVGKPTEASVREDALAELDLRLQAIGRMRPPTAPEIPRETAGLRGGGFSLPGVGRYQYADEPAVAGGEGAMAAAMAASAASGGGGATLSHPLVEAAMRSMRPPKLVYASRTHSQLSQVVRELKRSAYHPKVVILASREQLCVHPQVSKLRGQQQGFACRARCRERKCSARNTLEDWLAQKRSVHELPLAVKGAGNTLRMPSSGAGGEAAAAGDAAGQGVADIEDAPIPPLLDVDELAEMGRSKGVCPYFAGRDGAGQLESELVLVPYNYLVDPEVRRSLSIDWEDAIVVVDEAHNLEGVASEAASFDFGPRDFANAQREVQTYLEGVLAGATGAPPGAADVAGAGAAAMRAAATAKGAKVSPDLALRLKSVIQAIEADVACTPLGPRGWAVHPGSALVALFDRFGVNESTWDQTRELFDGITEWLMERESLGGRSGAGGDGRGLALTTLKEMMAAALRVPARRSPLGDEHGDESSVAQAEARRVAQAASAQFFRMVVHKDSRAAKWRERRGVAGAAGADGDGSQDKVLSYWCFSPGVAFGELRALGVRSVVLTSGTLSPMSSYAAELQAPFPVRLENPHVVDSSQLLVGVVPRGPMRRALNSSFRNRSTDGYKQELGGAVRNLAKLVPDGMLVFFPSYAVMDECVSFWKADNGGSTWMSIAGLKHAVVESRSPGMLAAQMKEFSDAIESGKGGIFFAVCRGKVSEGLDFSDRHGRAVLITGLPYPPRHDTKVVLKQQYLDDAVKAAGGAGAAAGPPGGATLTQSGAAGPSGPTAASAATARLPSSPATAAVLTGEAWYQQQASRAVNQAIGRVIRHRRDWGAILLLDERFERAQQHLSAWLRPYSRVMPNWGAVTAQVRGFFAAARAKEAATQSKSRAGVHGMVGGLLASGLSAHGSQDGFGASAGHARTKGAPAEVGDEDDDADDEDDEAALERLLDGRNQRSDAPVHERLSQAFEGPSYYRRQQNMRASEGTAAQPGAAGQPAAPAGGAAEDARSGEAAPSNPTLLSVLRGDASAGSGAAGGEGAAASGAEVRARRGAAFRLGRSGAPPGAVAGVTGRATLGRGTAMLQQLQRRGEESEARAAAERLQRQRDLEERRRRRDRVLNAVKTAQAKAALAAMEGEGGPSSPAAPLVGDCTDDRIAEASMVSEPSPAAPHRDRRLGSVARPRAVAGATGAPGEAPAASAGRGREGGKAPSASPDSEVAERRARMLATINRTRAVILAGPDGRRDAARAADKRCGERMGALLGAIKQWKQRAAASEGDAEAQRQSAGEVARRWARIVGVLPAQEEASGAWPAVVAPMRERVLALADVATMFAGSKRQGFEAECKAIVRELKAGGGAAQAGAGRGDGAGPAKRPRMALPP